MSTLKLSDTTISQIAKLLQMAILTGTDVVDHLRLLELVDIDGTLEPSPAYAENFNINLERMLEEASQLSQEPASE